LRTESDPLKGEGQTMSKTIHWGVVGTGEICQTITPDFALTGNAEVTAVASRNAESASTFASRFGIPRAFGSYEALLADAAIDAVYLGTPHAVHHSMAVQALDAGKHVLIEKPMALNGTQAREILDLAAANGLFAMEAMWSNFSPTMIGVMDAIATGKIGVPRTVHAKFGAPFPRDSGSRWSADLGGSTLLDQGIYPVALAQAVLGVPDSISVKGSVRQDGVDLAEHFTCEYPDSAYAQLAVSMMEFIEPTASVSGTEGWISIPDPFWASPTFTVHSGGFPDAIWSAETTTVELEGKGYTPMLRAVSACILDGALEHPLHTRTQTLEVFGILDLVRAELLKLDAVD
jgi:predicted dehydrogenase